MFAGLKAPRRASTIADLADTDDVTAEHLAEAIRYRRLDRQLQGPRR